jgi:RimJ/RimL family protein N-acetyltransferase
MQLTTGQIMTPMQSKNLSFEMLMATHADALFPILTTPAVLAFIDEIPPTLEELRMEYANCARGPKNPTITTEQWFNMAIYLKESLSTVIGRLEATCYGQWGELAYLLGEAWWGKGLAFEAMCWWHDYLKTVAPEAIWWATVHPANQRSIRLLKRLGYKEVESDQRPQLQSYDAGDCCFVKIE